MNSMENKVIAGYDGSEESKIAVRWAAVVAKRRAVPLLVVAATDWDEPPKDLQGTKLATFSDQLIYDTAHAGALLARKAATVEVEAIGVQRKASAALIEYSSEAQLIVVGHQDRGKLRGVLPGSVAYAVANHAKCPVAIARSELHPLPTSDYPSVVAIDGSQHSDNALETAARWAFETNSLLRTVVAWKTTLAPTHVNYAEKAAQAARHAREISQAATEQVASAYPELQVEPVIAEGR